MNILLFRYKGQWFMIRKLSVSMLLAVTALAALPGVSTSAQAGTVVTLNAAAVTGGAHVIKADIVASNGVIHVIDSVLVPPSFMSGAVPTAAATMAGPMAPAVATMAAPAATMAGTMAGPTIADIVAGNPDFSTLLAALKATNLVDMFTKPGTYTVFAPNNAAFDVALKAMGMTPDQLLAQPEIVKSVLTYHVLGTVVMAADLAKLTKVTTVEGEDITVSVGPAPVATMAATMAAAPMSATTLSVVKNDKLGSFLVGPDGKTLYTYKKDTAGVSTCTDKCAAAWPPLTVATGVTPSAASGVAGKLATITRADGTLQVTYNGLPLYYFAKDVAAGDTNGQAVGTVWYVAAP
jgi:uncharacterized surface protein with fasciclin (FAS1) repeats